MGFRFRKSVSFGPFRVNLSKSGIGYSVGTKGARITKTAKGRTRTTLSVPGTGVSYVSESLKKKGNKKKMSNYQPKANEVSCTATSEEYNVSNIFNKFELSDKEILLLEFISNHYTEFNNEFSIHDISALGHIATSTYYNNLYDKALLLKPSRGKYALNTALINKLAEEEVQKQKAIEEERLRKEKAEAALRLKQQIEYEAARKELEEKKKIKKAKNDKITAYMSKFILVPLLVILGLLFILIEEYIISGIMLLPAVFYWNFQHKYFKNIKQKGNVS